MKEHGNKGKIRTQEMKDVQRKLKLGNKNCLGKHWKVKDVSNMRKGQLGRKHTQDSIEKTASSVRGDKHWNWKGGIGKSSSYFKRGDEYKQWRKMCVERDNFTCQCCGHNGGKLEVHHILNFSEFEELRTITSNGITLCRECHKKFHHEYGIKNNTKEQLYDFFHKYSLNK